MTPRVEVVESRMRGNTHVRFGGRAGETERPKGRHRASVRPYYVKVRDAGRVVSMACLVAIGVAASGERRVLGLELAAGNDEGSAWVRIPRVFVHPFRSNPYTRSDPFRTAFRGFRTPRGVAV